MLTGSQFITFLVSLFAITNPIGNLAIFISLTADKPKARIRKISLKIGLTIAIILILSTWLGKGLLTFFGISIPSFEIAGGLVIVLISLSMLQAEKARTSHTKGEERDFVNAKDSIAIVPMSIPIIAGPGAMTTAVLAGQKYATFCGRVELSIGCIIIASIVMMVMFFSSFITKMLGKQGVKVFARVMGLVLLAIAFNLIIGGISGAFPGLHA